MSKVAVLFIAAFCLVQISLSARIEKRDAIDALVPTTTEQSFFQSLKTGLENTFTKERFDKVKDSISSGASQAYNYTSVGINKGWSATKDVVTNRLKKDDVPSNVAPVPAPAAA